MEHIYIKALTDALVLTIDELLEKLQIDYKPLIINLSKKGEQKKQTGNKKSKHLLNIS